MSGVSMGFFMILAGLMGLAGLTLSARSGDIALNFGGLVVFVLAVLVLLLPDQEVVRRAGRHDRLTGLDAVQKALVIVRRIGHTVPVD